MSCQIAKTEIWKIMILLSGHKMLKFDNTIWAAQLAARPKSSFPFYEKLSTYVSPRVSEITQNVKSNILIHKSSQQQDFMKNTLNMEVNWPSFANFFMPKPQNLPVTHNLQEFISSYRFFLLTPVVVDHSWSNHSSIDSNQN